MQKITLEKFINKARKIHGNKYDYSKVECIDSKTKVCIICPIHGEFWQKPNKHINCKQGCPKCAGRKLSTEEIREKLIEIFGEKYDFSKFVYQNATAKSCVICKEHGEFYTSWHKLKEGHGCPICATQNQSELRLKTILEKNFENVIYQKKFDWLGKQSLDFYLPKYNVGIEYQGRQHFCNKTRFNYEETLERDLRKRSLCKKNGIDILYFTYEKRKIPKEFQYYKIYTNVDLLLKEISDRK